MIESYKKFTRISIWWSIITFIIRCSVTWGEVNASIVETNFLACGYSLFGYAGEAIGFTAIVMLCFNKWCWKWKLINKLTGGMPVLASRYKGRICFIRDAKEQERDAEIQIEQTFLSVVVKLTTAESSSSSVVATIESVNNEKRLVYTYMNEPRAELTDRSAIHYGTAIIKVDNPKHLTGNYYTSRLSRGSMDFEASSD